MRASTKNLIWGTYHKMRGSVRTTVGSTLNSRRTAFSGRVERAGGVMQVKLGRVERFFGW